jgi:hypothetical protein
MKLHLVHDAAGRILAAADITRGAMGPRPMAGKGQHELVVDVPAEHEGKHLHEVCQSLRVDTHRKSLVSGRLHAGTKEGGTKQASTRRARAKRK